MNLCDDGHDEICYSQYTCPLCACIKDRDHEFDLQDRAIDALKDQVADLKQEIRTCETTIRELEIAAERKD